MAVTQTPSGTAQEAAATSTVELTTSCDVADVRVDLGTHTNSVPPAYPKSETDQSHPYASARADYVTRPPLYNPLTEDGDIELGSSAAEGYGPAVESDSDFISGRLTVREARVLIVVMILILTAAGVGIVLSRVSW